MKALTRYITVAVSMIASGASAEQSSLEVSGAGAAAASDADQIPGTVQEIVVTAQRRSQRIQDVPISINAVTADVLSRRGISDVTSLQTSVSGLEVPMLSTVAQPYIRGIGSNAGDANNEASVAMYVDGIYIASANATTFDFNNIERIEVLKGPQGTLFGRNATGGVIQIVTRDPSYVPSIEARIGYGNYDSFNADVYGTAGLSDSVAIDVAAQYKVQANGFGRNLTLGIDTHKAKSFVARSKLLFAPTDHTRLILAADYGYLRTSMSDWNLPPGVLGVDGQTHYPGRHLTEGDVVPRTETRQLGASARLEQDVAFARLISLTSYRKTYGFYDADADATPLSIVFAQLVPRQHNWTQELQLASPPGSKTDWLFGAFYFDGTGAYRPARLGGAGISTQIPFLDIFGSQQTRSWSVYGQATREILPRIKLTGGLRYTREKQSLEGRTETVFGAVPAARLTQTLSRPTWRLALEYKLADDISSYISYNRGIKSGGYALASLGSPGYKPEIVDAYELGIKSYLFARRLRLNVAAFQYDYKDIQVTTFVGNTTQTLNAAKARIKGLEADVQAVPLDGLTISGGLTYLDGKYRDFPNPVIYPVSIFDPPIVLANAAGNRTIRSPKLSGNVGLDYDIQTASGNVRLSTNGYYNDGFFWDAGNITRQKSYFLLSASIGWESDDRRFGITLWGKNLTDKNYLVQGNPSALGFVQVEAAPRTYGVTLTTKL